MRIVISSDRKHTGILGAYQGTSSTLESQLFVHELFMIRMWMALTKSLNSHPNNAPMHHDQEPHGLLFRFENSPHKL